MSYPPPGPPTMPYGGYADPYRAAARPPASIKAIGICGCILGGLALANHALGIVMFVTVPAMTAAYGPANRPFQIANSVVFGTAAVVLVVGSVASLVRAEWGRRTLVAYAVVYPVLLLVGTGVMVGWFIPHLMAPHESGPDAPAKVAGAYGGAAVACVAMLVLPVFILVYFRRPAVRAAFGPTAVGTVAPYAG